MNRRRSNAIIKDIGYGTEGGDENVRPDENDERDRPWDASEGLIDVHCQHSERRNNPMKTKIFWVMLEEVEPTLPTDKKM